MIAVWVIPVVVFVDEARAKGGEMEQVRDRIEAAFDPAPSLIADSVRVNMRPSVRLEAAEE